MDMVQLEIQPFQLHEQQFSAQILNDAKNEQTLETLEKLRASCSAAVLKDIRAASSACVEQKLWDSHQKLNSTYRAALRKSKTEGSKKAIELRKLSSEYLRFIKSSQLYYRSFISDLSHSHGGIPRLERLALRLNRQAGSPNRSSPSPAVEALVLESCHRTLIQLGDLSRYREAELAGKQPDWSHATKFYDLAAALYPSSGIAHNQLSVVALSTGDLGLAVYHLYRSLATKSPHPQAEGNLRKAFFKISAAHDQGTLTKVTSSADKSKETQLAEAFTLRLLSKFYHGKSLAEHEQTEQLLLSNLLTSFKADASGGTHRRLALTIIAACWFAQERFQSQGGELQSMISFVSLLRLNVNVMTMLLHAASNNLLSYLNNKRPEEAVAEVASISPSTKELLVLVRIYSSWLVKNVTVMTNNVHPLVDKLQAGFWIIYVRFLTLLAQNFPAKWLPENDCLLGEDVETLGFQSLICDGNMSIWYHDGKTRSSMEELGQGPVTSTCVLSRIRSILAQGLALSMDEPIPLNFVEPTCSFHTELVAESNALPYEITPTSATTDPSDASRDREEDAERMVSGLVDTETEGVIAILSAPSAELQAIIKPKENELAVLDSDSARSPSLASRLPQSPRMSHTTHHSAFQNSAASAKSDAISSSRPATGSREPSPIGLSHSSQHHNRLRTPVSEAVKLPSSFPRLSGGGHHRTYSNESVRSLGSIWSPSHETLGNYKTSELENGSSRTSSVALGNGTFGLLDADRTAAAERSLGQSPNVNNAAWRLAQAEAEQRFRSSPNILLEKGKG